MLDLTIAQIAAEKENNRMKRILALLLIVLLFSSFAFAEQSESSLIEQRIDRVRSEMFDGCLLALDETRTFKWEKISDVELSDMFIAHYYSWSVYEAGNTCQYTTAILENKVYNAVSGIAFYPSVVNGNAILERQFVDLIYSWLSSMVTVKKPDIDVLYSFMRCYKSYQRGEYDDVYSFSSSTYMLSIEYLEDYSTISIGLSF